MKLIMNKVFRCDNVALLFTCLRKLDNLHKLENMLEILDGIHSYATYVY